MTDQITDAEFIAKVETVTTVECGDCEEGIVPHYDDYDFSMGKDYKCENPACTKGQAPNLVAQAVYEAVTEWQHVWLDSPTICIHEKKSSTICSAGLTVGLIAIDFTRVGNGAFRGVLRHLASNKIYETRDTSISRLWWEILHLMTNCATDQSAKQSILAMLSKGTGEQYV